jgi:transketolase
MRDTLSNTLVALARADPNVLLLTGDHGYALFDAFRRACPNQYINAGIAEQNMVGMAAGLAKAGYLPIVYGLSAFIPIRVLEQIKLDVCHDNLPVIFLGDGAGFVYSTLGSSHQATEDIACTRAISNLMIFSPADAFELRACMQMAYKSKSPSYIRIGKSDVGKVHDSEITLEPGEIIQVREGIKNIAILATGSMVMTAIEVSSTIESPVWSVPIIKPINNNCLVKNLAHMKLVITMEEHNIIGGMGSSIAECLSERLPVRVLRIGVNDKYSHSCGSYDYLRIEHELDVASVTNKITKFLQVNGI